MNCNNSNQFVFDYFCDIFEKWLCLNGAEADPNSFDHLDPRLGDFLIRIRKALLKYYGLRIFTPV